MVAYSKHKGQPDLKPLEADLQWSPAFGVDEQQRILLWSKAAETLLNIPSTWAIGRACYEVLRGRDFFGRPFCRKGCPAFSYLLDGHLQSHCALELELEERKDVRVRWQLLALPPGSRPRVMAFFGHQSPELAELALSGHVASSLSAPIQIEALQDILGWAVESTGMEAAELFLRDWQTPQMVLTARQGPFADAFCQMTQFPLGQGYPGLVAATGAPIMTNDLSDDPRYLRTRVKERGFTEYVCVPLLGPTGVEGDLNVASRRRQGSLPSVLSLLTRLAQPLSAAITTTILQARDSVADFQAQPAMDIRQNLELMLKQVLAKMIALSGADSGAAVLRDPATGGVTCRVAEGEREHLPFCDVGPVVTARCPTLAEPKNVLLAGHRSSWPQVCRGASGAGGPMVCLPFVADGKAVGVVSLRFGAKTLISPTRYLGVLSALAQRAALLVKNVQSYQRLTEEAIAAERERFLDALRGATAPSQRVYPSEDAKSPGPAASPESRAFLDIRCFGDFRIYQDGHLLTSRAFPRRQALTALKVLIMNVGRKVPKEVLSEHLWPGSEPEVAANRLYGVMHALREALELGNGPSWLFVLTDGDSYYWNTDAPYRLDVDEFRDGIRRGEALERQGQVAQAVSVYQATAHLYRGDFMNDEPYSDWCWSERELYREIYLGLMKKIAHLLEEQGNVESAVLYYRQALLADPLREEIQRELVRCLWREGRRDEALRQYATFSQRLRQELGVEPLPETQELYRSIAGSHSPGL